MISKIFIYLPISQTHMATETVSISSDEYAMLKKKEAVADDLLLQLNSSLKNLESGKIKRVR